MKTLADFKRALTVGSSWRVIWLDGSSATRTVSKTQTNGVYFAYDNERRSFLDYPKADDFAINEHGQVEIYRPASTDSYYPCDKKLILKYEKVS